MWCWCDELDKPLDCITSDECDDGCCDSCMHCICTEDDKEVEQNNVMQ